MAEVQCEIQIVGDGIIAIMFCVVISQMLVVGIAKLYVGFCHKIGTSAIAFSSSICHKTEFTDMV